MTPSAETLLCPPPPLRRAYLTPARNLIPTTRASAGVPYVRVRPGTRGGWGVECVCVSANGIRPRLLGCSSSISGLTVACAVSSYDITGGLSGDKTGGRAATGFPCCKGCIVAAAGAVQAGERAGEISAIPPHPQITAVQESHCPPTGVAQRAVPEWKDRGGGVRRWDQDDERPILGAGLILARWPSSSCLAGLPSCHCYCCCCCPRGVCVCVPLVLGFWVGSEGSRQAQNRPADACTATQRSAQG